MPNLAKAATWRCIIVVHLAVWPIAVLAQEVSSLPEILELQRNQVAMFETQLLGMKQEEKVGQRTTQDIIRAVEQLYNAKEELALAELSTGADAEKDRDRARVQAKLDVAEQLVAELAGIAADTERRMKAGEVTPTDVASAKGSHLGAAIKVEQLTAQLKRLESASK